MLDTLAVGGTENSLADISSKFSTYEPVFASLYTGDALLPKFRSLGLRTYTLRERRKYAFIHVARQLRELIDRVRPHVVHSSLYRADVVSRLALVGTEVPLVSSFVNDPYSDRRTAREPYARRLKLAALRTLDARTAPRVDAWVANSNAVLESNVEALGLDGVHTHIIYRGRDTSRFRPPKDAGERATLRTRLGLPADAPIVVNVARMLERKGQFDAIQAWPRVQEQLPSATLVFVGDGHDRERVERAAVDAGVASSVRFLGRRLDVDAILRAADLFLFPSHFEGFPGALLEAMATGLPCVASDIPMHREALVHGTSGWLVSPRHPEALATAVVHLLCDRGLSKRLGGAARARVLERFSLDQVSQQHERFYDDVIQRFAGRGLR